MQGIIQIKVLKRYDISLSLIDDTIAIAPSEIGINALAISVPKQPAKTVKNIFIQSIISLDSLFIASKQIFHIKGKITIAKIALPNHDYKIIYLLAPFILNENKFKKHIIIKKIYIESFSLKIFFAK